jgi:VWFA-related protein
MRYPFAFPGYLLSVSLALGGVPAAAQLERPSAEQDAAPGFGEVIEVNVVNVAVRVTDKEGNPIRGLTQDDFEILEDGRLVEVSNFYTVESGDLSTGSTILPSSGRVPAESTTRSRRVAARPSGVPVDVPVEELRHVAIFIDNNHLAKKNRRRVFQGLRDFLHESLDPRDQVMVVNMHHRYEVVADFSNNSADIVQAIDRLEKAPAEGHRTEVYRRQFLRSLTNVDLAPADFAGGDVDLQSELVVESEARMLLASLEREADDGRRQALVTILGLRYVMGSMAGLPGSKHVLYVSDGLPMRPEESLFHAHFNRFQRVAETRDSFAMPLDPPQIKALEYDLSRDFDALATHAQASGVVFNAIDGAGMRNSFTNSAEWGLRDSDSLAMANYQPVWNATLDNLKTMNLQSPIQLLATETGGSVLVNHRDYATFFGDLRTTFDNFYSLGYVAPHQKSGGHHRIKVKVLREGVNVSYQRAYRDKTWDQLLTDRTVSQIVLGVGSNDLNATVMPMRPEPREGRYVLPLRIIVPIDKLELIPVGEELVANLTVAIVLKEPNGSTREPDAIQVRLRLPREAAEELSSRQAEANVRLLVDPGEQTVGVGLRDQITGSVSTTSLELFLPEAVGS